MSQTESDHDASEERRKALEVMYQQVAAQHDKIDDFRGKLLAALPAITGLALFSEANCLPTITCSRPSASSACSPPPAYSCTNFVVLASATCLLRSGIRWNAS